MIIKSVPTMRPQDILVLLKINLMEDQKWTQIDLAQALFMSQSEISASLKRSTYSKLLYEKGRKVQRPLLMKFIQYGLPFSFPQQPGPVLRGIPTAHSAPPLKEEILSDTVYVWPSSKGKVRGQSIQPLYPSVGEAILVDQQLYELLALIDAVRIGRARERNLALDILNQRLS
ncbi:hypothetical protein [Pontibacter sp. G13]|uniref:hypothetical protein n=1 Tax=Pontibacter sp. G13 TaxID=3074898 RepID=UPI002889131D|nr:hypothetical protein [Pontibacter sp. G13]WNJ20937.1 hypothetical protein RJD25_10705 [Pontibacter sp. G13]